MASVPILRGQRVLVVEDEVLIAMDLAQAVEDAGGRVIGPAMNMAAAQELAETADITAALLDIQLHRDMITSVAEILARRRIPFVFYTGYGRNEVTESWPEAVLLLKPSSPGELVSALSTVLGKTETAGR